jgi:general secretion pathway protein I
MKTTERNHSGFTLLEVMIALAIFAVCAATLIQQSGRNIRQEQLLQTRTYANWIAENELERLRLQASIPARGETERELKFAGSEWKVLHQVSTTDDPDLMRVDIRVRPLASDDLNAETSGYRLQGFIGRY